MPIEERVGVEEAVERVAQALGDKATELKANYSAVDVTVSSADLVEVLTTLRDTDGIACRFFTFLSGVDRSEFGADETSDDKEGEGGGPKPPQLEVLIHLYSPTTTIHTTIHVPLEGAEPTCPSVTSVFMGAHWQERETHEMFGIDFEGHPGLINLYLPEDFEGHPLLKSFRLPGRAIKSWPGAKDPEEAAAGGR